MRVEHAQPLDASRVVPRVLEQDMHPLRTEGYLYGVGSGLDHLDHGDYLTGQAPTVSVGGIVTVEHEHRGDVVVSSHRCQVPVVASDGYGVRTDVHIQTPVLALCKAQRGHQVGDLGDGAAGIDGGERNRVQRQPEVVHKAARPGNVHLLIVGCCECEAPRPFVLQFQAGEQVIALIHAMDPDAAAIAGEQQVLSLGGGELQRNMAARQVWTARTLKSRGVDENRELQFIVTGVEIYLVAVDRHLDAELLHARLQFGGVEGERHLDETGSGNQIERAGVGDLPTEFGPVVQRHRRLQSEVGSEVVKADGHLRLAVRIGDLRVCGDGPRSESEVDTRRAWVDREGDADHVVRFVTLVDQVTRVDDHLQCVVTRGRRHVSQRDGDDIGRIDVRDGLHRRLLAILAQQDHHLVGVQVTAVPDIQVHLQVTVDVRPIERDAVLLDEQAAERLEVGGRRLVIHLDVAPHLLRRPSALGDQTHRDPPCAISHLGRVPSRLPVS